MVPEKVGADTVMMVPELEIGTDVLVDSAALNWGASVPERSWITAACATDEV